MTQICTRDEVDALLSRRDAYIRWLEDRIADLERWPSTRAARHAWLRAFVHLLVEGADDLVEAAGQRIPALRNPDFATMRELMRGRGEEIAARAAVRPDWWSSETEDGD